MRTENPPDVQDGDHPVVVGPIDRYDYKNIGVQKKNLDRPENPPRRRKNSEK